MRSANMRFVVLAALFALAGCGQNDSGDRASPSPGAAPAANVATPTPAAPEETIRFTFAHEVNMEHVAKRADGTRAREVLLEVPTGTIEDIDEAFRRDVVAAGYARPKPASRNGAIHSVYRNGAGQTLKVWVRSGMPAGERFKQKSAVAPAGTIYFTQELSAGR